MEKNLRIEFNFDTKFVDLTWWKYLPKQQFWFIKIIMEKNTFGKGIGVGGTVAVIIGIICQLTHNGGVP